MIRYIIRRVLYAVPILFGVNLLTFVLFFVVNTPNDIARFHLGFKHVTPQEIVQWKHDHGYDRALLFDAKAPGFKKVTHTVFFSRSMKLFAFDFGRSDGGRDIGYDIRQRMWPSFAIAAPTFVIGILVNLTVSLFLVLFRATYLDSLGRFALVVMMSISSLFYIIGGQYLFGKMLRLVPISGYAPGLHAFKFVVLPIAIGVISSLGGMTRLYRTFFLEEIERDYVRTARAKGLSELSVLFRHVLRNALIPILTGVVVVIPSLFLGSLIMESFFAIPGLGAYTLDAISAQDFAIVRAMVFLGSLLYIVGLTLTDISYTWVDPRVRLR